LKSTSEEKEGGKKDIVAELPHNIKVDALLRLAEVDYDEDAFKSTLSCIQPSDGSDWTRAKKEKFRDEVFRFRKELRSVAKVLRIPMKTCLAYYFGTYKSSDDYRLLKTVCVEERTLRMEATEHGVVDACVVCGDGGSLLICDGCEGEYHKECLRPQLRSIPDGHWECDECVDRKFLAAREYLVRQTRLFEEQEAPKKRSHGEMEEPSNPAPQKVIYRPSEEVQQAIRKLAKRISNVLAGNVPIGPLPPPAERQKLKLGAPATETEGGEASEPVETQPSEEPAESESAEMRTETDQTEVQLQVKDKAKPTEEEPKVESEQKMELDYPKPDAASSQTTPQQKAESPNEADPMDIDPPKTAAKPSQNSSLPSTKAPDQSAEQTVLQKEKVQTKSSESIPHTDEGASEAAPRES